MTSRKIGVFILCYNVEKTLPSVLDAFTDKTIDEVDGVFAIDNGSTDSTREIVRAKQRSAAPVSRKLSLICNKENYGSGGSQKIAFGYTIKSGLTHCIIVHGDAQGDPEKIVSNFVKKLDEKPGLDLISASRFKRGSDVSDYDKGRIIGNYFFNFITWVLSGVRMTDAGAGIICIGRDILSNIDFDQLDDYFHFNPQLNLLLHKRAGLKKDEVPLEWKDSEAGSNVRTMKYCFMLLKMLIKYFFLRVFLRRRGWRLFYSKQRIWTPAYEVEPACSDSVCTQRR